MSTNIFWRPMAGNRELPKQLKYSLAPKLWGHDGTLGGDPVTLSRDDLPFLVDIRDEPTGPGNTKELYANIKAGAETLISAINKYGTIEVFLE